MSQKKLKVAVVGATGNVGREMLDILSERGFPADEVVALTRRCRPDVLVTDTWTSMGHEGDGNFHFGYLIDPDSADERARAEDLNHRLVRRAIAMEGTCTGEHGIGIHKQDFLREECGDGAIAMMRAIKLALDPKQILNPGKIFAL